MRVAFEGLVSVAYMQMYVDSREQWCAVDGDHLAGQVNGLCGAAVDGYLFLTTGMHTGDVGLTIEVHEREPGVDDRWEEVVEAPFTPQSRSVRLSQWGDADACTFELDPDDYRVRYCAVGMDAAGAHGAVSRSKPPIDRYLLQFWPAPPAPDRVVRQTGGQAAYWHQVARNRPPRLTPEERAEGERLAREAQERTATQSRRAYELRRWGGRLPTDRLRHVRGNVHGLRKLDVDLTHAVAAVPDDVQRAIARWAAHRACVVAQLADVDWIAPALDALDYGRPLPTPFDDHAALWQRLFTDERIPHTTVTLPDGLTENALQQAMALPAVLGAAEPDSLQAALDALFAAAAAYGTDYRTLFDDVRRDHPVLCHSLESPIEEPRHHRCPSESE